jgi:BirA family biotin operon repressor/biotin-[acetyl-CoA-carboxylase] ligase
MYVARTNSTNTLLKELLAKSEWPEGEEFLYAGYQTAGRGQTGNGWESEEGKNLLCSILVERQKTATIKEESPFYLNVTVSVAVHRLLSQELMAKSQQLTVKWPNDLYWQDKKMAGILIENAIIGNEVKYSIAGIGLNINQTEWKSDAPNPVSLKQITGKEYNIDEQMKSLSHAIRAVLSEPEEEVWAYYKAHLYRKDGFWPFVERDVSIQPTMNADKQTKGQFMARIADILPTGEIVLEDPEGIRKKYHFKEIRFVV